MGAVSDEDLMATLTGQPVAKAHANPSATPDVSDLEKRYGIPAGLYGRLLDHGEMSGENETSPKGAHGRAQLMPDTAKELGVDPTDPAQNLEGGARYFAQQYKKFGDWRLAAAAYNAGPQAVIDHNGVPPYPETQAYVKRIFDEPGGPGDDEILSALTKGSADAAGTPAQGAPTVAQPPRRDFVLGLENGLKAPLDNAAVWVEGGLRKAGVPVDAVNKLFNSPSAEDIRQERLNYLTQKADQGVVPNAWGEGIGNIVATAPIAVATSNPFLIGAGSGALTTSNPHSIKETAIDAGVGGVLGKAADFGLNKLGAVISPHLSPAVNKLLQEGVRLTPGQTLGGLAKGVEDKLTSAPFLGDMIQGARARGMSDFNLAALNRVLKPFGEELPKGTEPGHEAIAQVGQRVSQAYNDLLTGLTVRADKAFSTGLGNVVSEARATLPPDRSTQLEKILRDTVTTKVGAGGVMQGPQLKAAESRLGEMIRHYSSSTDGDQRLMAGMLQDAQEEFRGLLARQNPAVADKLKAANSAFAQLVRVERAASSVAADHGVFTPAQLASAVKATDKSGRKVASARGNALMQDFASAGREVLPNKTPDSGTAGRLIWNTLAGAGLTGTAVLGHMNPAALIAGGMTMAPYTELGGRIANKLITARPAAAPAVRQALEKVRVPAILAAGAAPAVARAQEQNSKAKKAR